MRQTLRSGLVVIVRWMSALEAYNRGTKEAFSKTSYCATAASQSFKWESRFQRFRKASLTHLVPPLGLADGGLVRYLAEQVRERQSGDSIFWRRIAFGAMPNSMSPLEGHAATSSSIFYAVAKPIAMAESLDQCSMQRGPSSPLFKLPLGSPCVEQKIPTRYVKTSSQSRTTASRRSPSSSWGI